MKKIITIIVVLTLLISTTASASDYIITKKGSTICILSMSQTDSADFGMITYDNPTISELQSYDLPANLWKFMNMPDGVYDSRLQKMIKEKDEWKVKYYEAYKLAENRGLFNRKIIVGISLSVLILGILLGLLYLERRIKKSHL